MRNIFTDEKLNQLYEAQGYVILRNYYRLEDVERIRDMYATLFDNVDSTGGGVRCSIFEGTPEAQEAMTKAVKEVTASQMHRFFNECDHNSGVILDKVPGEREVLPHRGWLTIDEDTHECWNMWSLITEITPAHGKLYMLPGSHREEFHGLQARYPPDPPYGKFTHLIKKYSEYVELNLGDVVVFSNRTVHGSAANETDEQRPAMLSSFTELGAPLRVCYRESWEPGTLVEIYDLGDDNGFHYRNDNHDYSKPPQGYKLLERVPDGFPVYKSDEEFEKVCQTVTERAAAERALIPA